MKLSSALLAELKRLGLAVAAGALVGWALGRPLLGLTVAAVGLLGWHLRALWRLQRWLEAKAEPPPRPAGLWGDIGTRLERLERQCRKRKKRVRKFVQRFQEAVEATPDGAVIIDAHAQIEWLNRASARLLGLRQGQDHGRPLANLIRSPAFQAYLERPEELEPVEMDSPQGDGLRLLLRVVPYGANKRMLLVRDITRLHALEQMRKDFVANVSHELRSPLTVVLGYLEGMSDDAALPQRLRGPVAQMSEQAQRMSRIVEDLLRLSRMESDPGGAGRQPVQLSQLLAGVVEDARRLGAGKPAIRLDVDPDLIVLGDYNDLYSAFSNLVLNAVQYTPEDGAIDVAWRPSAGGGARLEVCDSGVGIEAAHIPRLTERFYRVDKARSRELGGTGLGLAIAKHVLMRHDAHLEVQSELGVGSTFACQFPASRVRQEAESLAGEA